MVGARRVPHPSESRIVRFAAGRLGKRESAALERHFGRCAGCRARLAAAAGGPEADAAWKQPAPPPSVGQRLGRYVLLEALGAGSLGVVYAAYDSQLDRRVALKLLRRGGHSPQHHRRLVREGQALARLSHPNVVAIYDAGSCEGQPFVATELVAGVDLRKWLADRARSVTEVLAVMQQAGRGLLAAHAAGLVHRDLKPENVLIDTDQRVRLTDFGLGPLPDAPLRAMAPRGLDDGPRAKAKVAARGRARGSPAYQAPEQQTGAFVDARSDQYSFCVVLHEALFGARPEEGRSPKSPRLPRAVPRALERGLSVDPADRYPSMGALLEALAGRGPLP